MPRNVGCIWISCWGCNYWKEMTFWLAHAFAVLKPNKQLLLFSEKFMIVLVHSQLSGNWLSWYKWNYFYLLFLYHRQRRLQTVMSQEQMTHRHTHTEGPLRERISLMALPLKAKTGDPDGAADPPEGQTTGKGQSQGGFSLCLSCLLSPRCTHACAHTHSLLYLPYVKSSPFISRTSPNALDSLSPDTMLEWRSLKACLAKLMLEQVGRGAPRRGAGLQHLPALGFWLSFFSLRMFLCS